jgi:hypothetical protein
VELEDLIRDTEEQKEQKEEEVAEEKSKLVLEIKSKSTKKKRITKLSKIQSQNRMKFKNPTQVTIIVSENGTITLYVEVLEHYTKC